MKALKSYFFAGVMSGLLLFTPGLEALSPVGPIIHLEGKVLGDPGFDGAADSYFSHKGSVIDPFVTANTNGNGQFSAGGSLPKLTVTPESNLRFYIYDEEARFNNQLGFVKNNNFDLNAPANANSLLLPNTQLDPSSDPPPRPHRGDYVNMGAFSDNDMLDFFLIQLGAADVPPQNPNIWWTDNAGVTNGLNPDGQSHAFLLDMGTDGEFDYFLLAFEDLTLDQNGQIPSNQNEPDFTDFVGVIQVGVPEPQTYLILGLTLAFVLIWHTRRKQAISQG